MHTTFQEAHNAALTRLLDAWKRVCEIHADPRHCNSLSRDYKKAQEDLALAEAALWRLKAVWNAE